MRKFVLGFLLGLVVCVSLSATAFTFPFLAPEKVPAVVKEAKLKDGFITLYGDIDPVSAKHVVDEIQRENKAGGEKPIYLFINSNGGFVSDGGLIISAIKSSKRPVYTVCVELCASMGAVAHQYGAKRFMLPYASIMFHEAAWGVQGQITHNRSREAWNEAQFARFETEVSKRSGCDIERFRAQENKEWWILADEAKKENFNDEVYLEGDFQAPKE